MGSRTCSKILHLTSVVFLVWRFCAMTSADWFNSTFIPQNNILINCGSADTSIGEGNRTWVGDVGSNYLAAPEKSEIAESPVNGKTAVPFSTARIFTEMGMYWIPMAHDSNSKFIRLYFHKRDYRKGIVAAFHVFANTRVLLKGGLDGFSSEYARHGDDLNRQFVVREFLVNSSSPYIHLIFMPDSMYKNSYAFINGIEIVSAPFNLRNSSSEQLSNSALETMYRLNVGGSRVPPTEDSGLFREWTQDTEYSRTSVDVSDMKEENLTLFYSSDTPAYIAPIAVYRTLRFSAVGLSWSMVVDPGFNYLVRLHFCGGDYPYGSLLRFNVHANTVPVLQNLSLGSVGIPYHRDFISTLTGQRENTNLTIQVRPTFNGAGLNGLEVFKLIDNSGLDAGDPKSPVATSPENRMNKHSINRVVGGAVGGSLAIVSLLGLLLFRLLGRRSNNKNRSGASGLSLQERPTTGNPFQSTQAPNPCSHFSYNEIKKATRGFSNELLLGVGGFGTVYRGNIDEDGRPREVAIKRAKPMSNQGVQEFKTEIEMLSQVRHRHLVSLIGFCEEEGEMILVYDYIAHGNLRQHLYKTNKPPLTWMQRLNICIGAARGLHYLHTGAEHPIIHRDVKSTNILLDIDWVAKVADFGLSKTSPQLDDHTHVSTAVKGTFGYIDPEYFQCQHLTSKSDVYSFGVVLFEILCARPAIDPKLPQEQVGLANWVKECNKNGTIQEIIDPYIRGQIATEVFVKFIEIARKCLANRGVNRPTMGQVLSSLETILHLQDNIDLGERLGTNVTCDGDDSVPLLSMDNNELNHISNCSNATITTINSASLAR